MRRPTVSTCLVAAMALGAAMSAWPSHRHRENGGIPGQFDFYLLSLSWSPAFCQQSPRAEECNGPRRYGFIVHGLWPQYERGWPEFCGGTLLPGDVAQGISDLMPARGLVYHEWSAHGTCSGLEPAQFFTLVRRAYESIAIPASFRQGGAIEQSPAALTGSFLRANPRLPADSVVATCSRQGAPRLREVHVCLDRDLAPRACSADALRQACREATMIVPPIR